MIPPRPWRADNGAIYDANGNSVIDSGSDYGTGGVGTVSSAVSELIVRLVNAGEDAAIAEREACVKIIRERATYYEHDLNAQDLLQDLAFDLEHRDGPKPR
jgi:hypothetical protein